MKNILIATVLLMGLMAGYVAGQKVKAAVSVNADIAWFTIEGSKLSHTATKRLTFVSMHYNDIAVPCILVDTQAGALSNDTVGGAAISCGWTPEAIGAINAAAK